MQIKSIIADANLAWNKALNNGNAKLLTGLYSENATISPGNGSTVTGRNEIEALFLEFFRNGVHHHAIDIIEVGGSDKIIYQISHWSANFAESSPFGGITMNVMEHHSDGKWLINSHVWNLKN